MMWFFLSLSCWNASGANIDSVMVAKTAAQIEKVHLQGVQERILKERCDIEIKQHWIPVSCFEWLEKTSLSVPLRGEMLTFFNKRCVSTLETNPPLPQKKIFKLITPGLCLERVQKYALDVNYKASASQTFTEIMRNVEVGREVGREIGREIVTESGHERPQTNQNQRIQSRRAFGRRLN